MHPPARRGRPITDRYVARHVRIKKARVSEAEDPYCIFIACRPMLRRLSVMDTTGWQSKKEILKERINKKLKPLLNRSQNEYALIKVLLLYWASEESGNDSHGQPTFKDEALELGSFFAQHLNYTVESYAIPVVGSQLQLDSKVGQFLASADDGSSLVIIHYGGHGDEDVENGGRQKAVWSANGAGIEGPSLRWYDIQPKFRQFQGHVLLVLDCCYAGQAMRSSDSVVPRNVEIMAACGRGKDARVPLPGEHSFTKAFIRAIKSVTRERPYASTVDIFKSLQKAEAGLPQSPIHIPLEDRASIRLKLLPIKSTVVADAKEEAAVQLRLSLNDALEDRVVEELIVWLKDHAPRAVSSILVEKIVYAHEYIYPSGGRGTSSIPFKELSNPARNSIVAAWAGFRKMASLATTFQLGTPPDNAPSHAEVGIEGEQTTMVVQELRSAVSSMIRAMERNILSSPKLSENREAFLQAIEDPEFRKLGMTDVLKLRFMAQFGVDPSHSMKTSHHHFISQNAAGLSCYVAQEEFHGTPVLIEYKHYDRLTAGSHDLTNQNKRIADLAKILETPSSSTFHTWRCVKWFHDEPGARYGLIFQYPTDRSTLPISLHQLISEPRYSRPSLRERFLIARAIGEALLNWHTAGFVHQGISSHNIIFFHEPGPATAARIDYARPYICGFEFTRPSESISSARYRVDRSRDVYRHPDRRGLPTLRHTKGHDVYSYGVVLVELGLWDLVGTDVSATADFEGDLRSYLLDNLRSRLGFYMGDAYKRAAEVCINSELDRPIPEHAAESFEALFEYYVLSRICDGSRL